MHERRQVAVTGIGLITPIGMNESEFRTSMREGRHGMAPVTLLDVSDLMTRHGAQVDGERLRTEFQARTWRRVDRCIDMALLAAEEALLSSGVEAPHHAEISTIVGTSYGPSENLEDMYRRFAGGGRAKCLPTHIPRGIINGVSAHISMKFGLQGPNYVVASACSAATNSIGIAFRMIRDGYADRVLCGGADAFFVPTLFTCWDKLGTMSRRDDPGTACRPFAADRDGFLLGEGAGMFILEALDMAESRGARIRGIVAGFGESSDASHLTRPCEQGQQRAIERALDCAGVGPSEVAFVNAHGTATKWNDDSEARSIRLALGEAADHVPVVSCKSYFGHTLGAAGALETAASLFALEDRILPANLNLDNPDPACNICLPHREPVAITAAFAIKNSFGFGGGNATLVLRRYGD